LCFDTNGRFVYDPRLMQARLPEWVDPLALVERRERLEGEIPLASLARLSELLSDTEGSLSAVIDFTRLEDRRPGVRGNVTGRLRLPCQRCLEAVELPVDLAFELYLVESEAMADRLPEGLEPLVNTSGRVSPRELVENEVLLSLPLIPRHAAGSCQPPGTPAGSPDELEETVQRENPFSILAQLRRSPEDEGSGER